MKIYHNKPELYIKIQILNPSYKNKYYLTFNKCNLDEALIELNEFLASLPERPKKGRKTQLRVREYFLYGIKGKKNGKAKSLSIHGYCPDEIYGKLISKFN